MRIEHDGLGLSFDLPELTQGDVEAYLRARHEIKTGLAGAGGLAQEVAAFARAVGKGKLEKEEFTATMREFVNGLVSSNRSKAEWVSGPETSGASVRAAARLGWLSGIDDVDVGEMPPAAVRWIADEIDTLVVKSLEIPKN